MSTTRAERPRTLDPYLGAVLGGRYRIERLIGRGGMGLVYLATDEVDAREVVIKLLAPHFVDDATAVSRFEREGKRLQQLAHPNVVQLLECGHDRGQAYIAMEYLDGEPLRRYLKRRGPLALQDFTPIAGQVLAAVGYAHDRSIMLRDIKPANIMLCERDGKANFVKVLDFGLAKLVDGDDEEVTKSHVIGTAGYLAPEQIKGEPSDVRVDVYAIGVMLYVMLSGESPIQGENDGALLYNHVHGTPKPLGSVLPAGHNIPEALIALVHQCLEKEPSRRPADASEIAEALFESVPPKLFALPLATDDSRKALADYRSARDRGLDPDAGPQSSEWTKPVMRPVGEPAPAEASTSALPRPARRATPVPPQPRR
ncbi:MAG: protein kinase [Myxococcales bacterium]|nr:protein kinase [Myxococcales bacterium]